MNDEKLSFSISVILIFLDSLNSENASYGIIQNGTESSNYQQGISNARILRDTSMINEDKSVGDMYHTMSKLTEDPLVLVPLSLLRAYLKRNISYASTRENNVNTLNVKDSLSMQNTFQVIEKRRDDSTKHFGQMGRSDKLGRRKIQNNHSTMDKSSIKMRTGDNNTPTPKGGKMTRKIPEVRKPPQYVCKVCGDKASNHIHYGGRSCHSCRAFFRRGVEAASRYINVNRIYMGVC